MADLIRTIESDLFGAYEWAAELYEEFADVQGAPERVAAARGLLRCYEGLEGKASDAMRAAELLVAAEEDLDDTERATLAPLDAPRDALFERADPASAQAFLDAFRPRWSGHAEKQALVPDAILAALAHSNVIAATRRKDLPPEEAKAHHVAAAELYEELYAMLSFRVGTGEAEWKETMQSCLYRASVAWRFAGEEARSKRAQEIAGPPQLP
ncbi:MAG TPA: hypothetical protein VM582_04105, partial [Candidatus Thermoplasmatota archaeon]|nr:hypothetical protein [Candidatus Thermoplasmatota archaeon]